MTLFSALMIGATGTFTSCKDYDDDIESLDNRVSAVEKLVSDLQAKIDAGSVITGVDKTEDGIVIKLSNGESYPIKNGTNGTNAPVWSIVKDANGDYWWAKDDVQTEFPARGEKGEPGVNGGPRGDLLVEVQVTRHPIFQRQDMNIISTAPITFAQAALGGDVKISTVDGDVLYTVKPGTQTDTKIRLKGKGVPSLRNSNVRGDHYVTLVVQTPTKLNEKAKEALRAFDEACGNRPAAEAKAADGENTAEQPKKKKGFMDKVKEAFEDIDK